MLKAIPEDVEKVIREKFGLVERNKVAPHSDTIFDLFRFYNEYIDGYPKTNDAYCGSCRITVIKAWRAYFAKEDARRPASEV